VIASPHAREVGPAKRSGAGGIITGGAEMDRPSRGGSRRRGSAWRVRPLLPGLRARKGRHLSFPAGVAPSLASRATPPRQPTTAPLSSREARRERALASSSERRARVVGGRVPGECLRSRRGSGCRRAAVSSGRSVGMSRQSTHVGEGGFRLAPRCRDIPTTPCSALAPRQRRGASEPLRAQASDAPDTPGGALQESGCHYGRKPVWILLDGL
jgi:hypothetical protein